MLEVDLIAGGKVLAQINVPETLNELPLGQYIDFLVSTRNEGSNHIANMAKSVSIFCGIDLQTLLQADFENQTAVGALSQLYAHIAKVIAKVKTHAPGSGAFAFTHDGCEYIIPSFAANALGGVVLPNLSVIEVIEAAEVQRLTRLRVVNRADPKGTMKAEAMEAAQAIIDKDIDADEDAITQQAERELSAKIDAIGDPKGNEAFGLYLRLIAILARKKGEHLPFDDAERQTFIENRAASFKTINAETALQVDFFLHSTLRNCKRNHPFIGFLIRHSFAAVAVTFLKRLKHTKGRRQRVQKHSGA